MPNRRPGGVRARALELGAQGLSVREIEQQLAREQLRASKSSVANWLKDHPPPAAGSGADRPAKVDGAEPGEEPWELPGVDLVHLPVELLERLAKRFAARISQELDLKAIDPQVLGALIRDHERLIKALVQARPPMQADPEKDPGNLEMGVIALGHVRRMIVDIRARRTDERGTP